MNTSELLAIIEPHKELLKGMGWTIEPIDGLDNFVFLPLGDEVVDGTPVAFAALIIENVARHALDEWQLTGPDEPPREYRMEPRTDGDTFGIASIGDNHNWEREGNSLAVALALLAWTKGQA